jgi:hypothetical protein
VGLVSVIVLIFSQFFSSNLKSYRVGHNLVSSQEKAAAVMREFEYSTRALYEITEASASALTFTRYFDLSSSDPKQVRFFLDGTTFKAGVTEPVRVGETVSYPAENESIELLIENVVDFQMSYLDASGEAVTDLTTYGPIKMVGLQIAIDNKVGVTPEPIRESTKVNLRNKKTNL